MRRWMMHGAVAMAAPELARERAERTSQREATGTLRRRTADAEQQERDAAHGAGADRERRDARGVTATVLLFSPPCSGLVALGGVPFDPQQAISPA